MLHERTIPAVSLFGLLGMLMCGCHKEEEAPAKSIPAPTAAAKTVVNLPSDLVSLKAEAEKAKSQADLVMASLDATIAAADGDPRPPFKKFEADLEGLIAQAETVRSRADGMKAKGKDYFKTWEAQLAQISTPDIKKAAEARRNELAKNYDGINVNMAAAREKYDKLISFLTDLKKVMGNELNAEGLKAIAPKVEQAKTGTNALKESVDAVLADVDKIAAIYSPGK